jgi:hypothetical protein
MLRRYRRSEICQWSSLAREKAVPPGVRTITVMNQDIYAFEIEITWRIVQMAAALSCDRPFPSCLHIPTQNFSPAS